MDRDQKLTLEWSHGKWFVLDPAGGGRVPIDTAIVDVTYCQPGLVEGFIVAVHGLDLEIAQHMSRETQQALGVGAQLRRSPLAKTRRGQLTADGRVDWV